VQPVLGISFKIVSALAFTLMSACLKLSSHFPTGELMFFRSLFTMIPLLIWLRWQGDLVESLKTSSVFGHFLRSATGSGSMFCSFAALYYLPLHDAIALGYASPILAVVLAALILKERVRAYRWSAVSIGFFGVLVMLWPHLNFGGAGQAHGSYTGAAFALMGALLAAAASIQIRKLTKTERVGAIVFYFTLMTTLIGLATAVFGWKMPNRFEFGILVLSGILGGMGQILLTQAYRLADTSVIVPFEYTTMLWAVALGWFIFGELPSIAVASGGIIVALSGLFIVWREHQISVAYKRSLEVSMHKPGNG